MTSTASVYPPLPAGVRLFNNLVIWVHPYLTETARSVTAYGGILGLSPHDPAVTHLILPLSYKLPQHLVVQGRATGHDPSDNQSDGMTPDEAEIMDFIDKYSLIRAQAAGAASGPRRHKKAILRPQWVTSCIQSANILGPSRLYGGWSISVSYDGSGDQLLIERETSLPHQARGATGSIVAQEESPFGPFHGSTGAQSRDAVLSPRRSTFGDQPRPLATQLNANRSDTATTFYSARSHFGLSSPATLISPQGAAGIVHMAPPAMASLRTPSWFRPSPPSSTGGMNSRTSEAPYSDESRRFWLLPPFSWARRTEHPPSSRDVNSTVNSSSAGHVQRRARAPRLTLAHTYARDLPPNTHAQKNNEAASSETRVSRKTASVDDTEAEYDRMVLEVQQEQELARLRGPGRSGSEAGLPEVMPTSSVSSYDRQLGPPEIDFTGIRVEDHNSFRSVIMAIQEWRRESGLDYYGHLDWDGLFVRILFQAACSGTDNEEVSELFRLSIVYYRDAVLRNNPGLRYKASHVVARLDLLSARKRRSAF